MFLAGLVFDGQDKYRNISSAVDDPQIGRLSVFTNPSFETFDGTRRYDPDDEELIDIKVSKCSIKCACTWLKSGWTMMTFVAMTLTPYFKLKLTDHVW